MWEVWKTDLQEFALKITGAISPSTEFEDDIPSVKSSSKEILESSSMFDDQDESSTATQIRFAFGSGVEWYKGASRAISANCLVSLASKPSKSSTSLSMSENKSKGILLLCSFAIATKNIIDRQIGTSRHGFSLHQAGDNDTFREKFPDFCQT